MIRLVLYKKKINKSGLAPIYLKINIGGKISYLSTSHHISPHLWDKKSEQVKEAHPLADQINTDIINKKREAYESVINARVNKQNRSSQAIKLQLVSKNNFFAFAETHSISVQRKRAGGTLTNYNKHLKKLELFNGSRNLTFEEITPEYLTDFENWIEDTKFKRKEGSNYAFAIMKTIRTLFNAALNKKLIEYYPFKDYEMPEDSPGDKDHLTLEELDQWTEYYKEAEGINKEAALYFLFGCYSGLRISDWFLFNKKNIGPDYITLRAKKNGERVSIPIHSRLRFIINEMGKVPLITQEIILNRHFKEICKAARIDKYISSHCARKTFAVTICLERGVSSETAAELMGITLATFVKSYSRVTPEKIRRETTEAWKGI